MSERKQGRRSAEEAEHTKCEIMRVAADMFAEHGFEGVSLRNISEKAGVSHSLIRYHFGSKEKIWKEVTDAMDAFMQEYIVALMDDIPKHLNSANRAYQFLVRMNAFTLVIPQPIQFIADAVRVSNSELFEYFIATKDEFATMFDNLFDEYNQENPNNPINIWEMRWQMLQSAHAAVSLKPMLDETWPEYRNNPDKLLLKHWQLFSKNIAMQLHIPLNDHLNPESLDELLLPMANCATATTAETTPSEAALSSCSAAPKE
ncbi:TetR/AcrR family transcriptional regulator [Vibrio sp. SM6]|uniref:TetR/AcrR family transcriptional regulator n=1 Tax=Vibrio agarilyticus TaxID=2726741 RepID=A0A7X8TR12_9VIBR|nr:TetR/AcrR family transcriptional regulator [Vibrio agarilyticus]NLS13295.1 TetR/AcrR family transcriptional regulator [Vibrio agarilyticus]